MPTLAFVGCLNRPSPEMPRANGDGIGVYAFDESKGHMNLLSTYDGIDNPSFLALDSARLRLYAVSETPECTTAKVLAFAIDSAAGTLAYLNSRSVQGNMPCHVALGDGMVFVSNFSIGIPLAGQAGVLAFLLEDGGSLGEATSTAPLAPGSHPHSATLSTDRADLLVADLGLDRITIHAVSATGFVPTPHAIVALPKGSGPRHLALGRRGRVYVLNELSCTVATLAAAKNGAFSVKQITPLPLGETITDARSAEIVASADGKYLFASNRGPDTINVFTIGDDGVPHARRQYPSGGRTPRNMALSPSGRHLLVANQDSNEIVVSAFDATTGVIGPVCAKLSTGTPMNIVVARFR